MKEKKLLKLMCTHKSDEYPSRWGVLLNIMKNWDPFVLGPLFAIERRPASVWATLKFSSNGNKMTISINHNKTYPTLKTYILNLPGNFPPYILSPPVPAKH